MKLDTLLQDHFPQWSYRNLLSSLSVLILNMKELFRAHNTQTVWALLISIFNLIVFSIMFLVTKQTKQH